MKDGYVSIAVGAFPTRHLLLTRPSLPHSSTVGVGSGPRPLRRTSGCIGAADRETACHGTGALDEGEGR